MELCIGRSLLMIEEKKEYQCGIVADTLTLVAVLLRDVCWMESVDNWKIKEYACGGLVLYARQMVR